MCLVSFFTRKSVRFEPLGNLIDCLFTKKARIPTKWKNMAEWKQITNYLLLLSSQLFGACGESKNNKYMNREIFWSSIYHLQNKRVCLSSCRKRHQTVQTPQLKAKKRKEKQIVLVLNEKKWRGRARINSNHHLFFFSWRADRNLVNRTDHRRILELSYSVHDFYK